MSGLLGYQPMTTTLQQGVQQPSGLLNYQPGYWSQQAYQMAGSPLQGPYPSVPVPAGTSAGTATGGSSFGGTALGILGALAKNPSLVKSIGNGVQGLLGGGLGGSLPAGVADSSAGIGDAASGFGDTAATGGAFAADVPAGITDASAAAGDAAAGTGAGAASGGLGGLSGGQWAGAAAIPFAAYNEVKNWQSGSTGSDALGGAGTGAAIGTAVMPGIGTAIGAGLGALGGAVSSAFGPGKTDPETQDVQGLINYTSGNNNDPTAAQNASNPYLELAGLMDERSSTLPMYSQYGRMGEQAFTNDLVKKINSGPQGLTPQQEYSQVISPWVSGMGSGWNNVGQTYQTVTQGLLQDMVNQYMAGQAPTAWKAVGGDEPFANLAPYGGTTTNAPTSRAVAARRGLLM